MEEAASIIREIQSNFESDEKNSQVQEEYVPEKLVDFINRILFGSKHHSQAALTIAQLIKYNFVKRIRPDKQSYRRHNTSQDTPPTNYR